ncbi:iron complex transport system permease protein [Meinhardsimonia xiamenensis]|jgi:iron complex transport system permease protein|uniref:Iron complex transport system permease protein n=1 Tax=Meinhardsimonia xiamenensis TaxID=990712 RepID=A0A1G9FPT6_9RHOB|nr:iron chelate uptake ABC transporter family permease subunit [Meinhardsimonia xiamenensis]PRX37740.1 iron complex transport system permease protein [Meinhardsimonia xiamenensis]SDK90426.1 iron complex transport system permease protein [Meinhardsimonia xiamenensis]
MRRIETGRGHVAGVCTLALLAGASVLVGAGDPWRGDLDARMVLAVSRIPRTCAALLAGAGLALAGVVIQQTVRNRLVEPGLSGTPEAAMIGLMAVTLIAPGAALLTKMSAAAALALAGTGGFFLLARRVPRRDPMLLPLVGLIYAGILGSIAMWIAWTTDLVQLVGIWQTGEFSGVLSGRYELLWLVAGLAGLLYLIADRITILGLGEDHARALGLDYRKTVLAGLAIVAMNVAVVVATVGAMPFVGLVVPNLASRWWGDNLRRNLPRIAMLGGGLVLAADLTGRLLRWPYEIPAASVFAVAGAALFLWLINAPGSRDHG